MQAGLTPLFFAFTKLHRYRFRSIRYSSDTASGYLSLSDDSGFATLQITFIRICEARIVASDERRFH